jgi:undecaprenyl pyrophosphate synthase
MRSEVERAFDEGGEIKGRSSDKTFEEMKQRFRSRVLGEMKMLPTGEMVPANKTSTSPMRKWELNRLAKEVDPNELEMLAHHQSLQAGEEGGRIEVYAGGAMEWVPNGPGGVPQPTTGDVFFDPIADEQRKIQGDANMKQLMQRMISQGVVNKPSASDKRLLQGGRKKFARGGVVKKFQNGGLAQVAGPLDEDEEEGFDAAQGMGVDQILSSVGAETPPDLYKMAAMNRDTALQQLRAGQAEFSERRDRQNKRAKQDRWLAMAQAMLSPTKTGGFGENLGMAAGALRDQSAQQMEVESLHAAEEQRFAEREMEVAGDYFDSLANLEGFKNNSRARVVGTKTVITPEDNARIAAKEITEADAERNVISIIMQPDGKTVSRIEKDANGRPWVIVDPKLVPSQAAAQTVATVTAASSVRSQFDTAKMGVNAIPIVTKLQRAYGLLRSLKEDTSGLNEKIRQVAQWAGISELIDDNTTLAVIHQMFGRQVLDDLRMLTGSKTDYEYGKVEGMNANLGKSVPESLAILDEHMIRLNEMVDKGEFAAQNISQGPGTEEKDFLLKQYLNHRKFQAEAAVEYDAKTREAPESKLESLIEAVRQNEGNLEEQSEHIKMFRKYYDIPEEVELILRTAGAGI